MPIHDPNSFEAGDWLKTFAFGSRRAFDDTSVESFLQDLSRTILKNRAARAYPDLVTFGYFCRKASIGQARTAVSDPHRRMGWGTLIHIAPSNIPVNFAFSLVMGMVAGNSNIVRLPAQTYAQMDLMVQIFDEVAASPEHAGFARETVFVQSDRDSARLKSLVAQAHGLIVWGGDATVEYFRGLPKVPRCIEAYFPNRVSSALFSAQAVLELGEEALHKLCLSFFNDTYLVDQNACSSPSMVFWHGSPVDCKFARVRFWDALDRHLRSAYKLDPVARIERSLDVMAMVDVSQSTVEVMRHHDDIWRLSNHHLRDQTLRFGMFLEVEITTLAQFSKLLRHNEQTLSVFGIDRELVFDALKADLACVDRIVSVGRALDIGFNWDGREMLSLLSSKTQVG